MFGGAPFERDGMPRVSLELQGGSETQSMFCNRFKAREALADKTSFASSSESSVAEELVLPLLFTLLEKPPIMLCCCEEGGGPELGSPPGVDLCMP